MIRARRDGRQQPAEGSVECVGIHASRNAERFEAMQPLRQAVRERFGTFAKSIAHGLALRHNHGSQYVSHHFQAEVHFLGIESSPAFVREPEGNGCAERFIRVLKENRRCHGNGRCFVIGAIELSARAS